MNICEVKKIFIYLNVCGILIFLCDEIVCVRFEYIVWYVFGVVYVWFVGIYLSWLIVLVLKIIFWEVCWEYFLFYRVLNRENLMEEIWINVFKFIFLYLIYFVLFVKK